MVFNMFMSILVIAPQTMKLSKNNTCRHLSCNLFKDALVLYMIRFIFLVYLAPYYLKINAVAKEDVFACILIRPLKNK